MWHFPSPIVDDPVRRRKIPPILLPSRGGPDSPPLLPLWMRFNLISFVALVFFWEPPLSEDGRASLLFSVYLLRFSLYPLSSSSRRRETRLSPVRRRVGLIPSSPLFSLLCSVWDSRIEVAELNGFFSLSPFSPCPSSFLLTSAFSAPR